ncbi:hypothetical protein L7F22_004338 [Adiantum nelumboides]|nr:hypothetical protein [Adiantum nelumboides]
MSWNVRGLCSLARQMYVKKLIQSEKLDIVMMQRTKTGALSLQVKGYACITSKADRGSGGCMTLISNACKVKEVLQPDCGRWIACQVCIHNEWIGVINVYAPNCPQERKLMWGQLSQIDSDVPLLFAGDWNCEDAELQSNEWIAWKNKFDAVDVASLQGCDALAYPTWTNRHLKSGFVARRLDRIYLSDKGSWVSHEMQGELMYTHTISDHTPVRIQFKSLRAKKDSELITALRKPDGGVTEDETEIKEMFKDSLFGIVGSPMTWNEQLHTFLEPMDSKINEEKKLLLGIPFSVYEVETVVKAMKKEKTPGLDGIQAEVLQELIKYAGQDLCDLLNHWRREGTIQPEFNQGLIKLIPKGQDKMEVKNYRPLTMLNTMYTVMAKALALRVRTVVSQVVHPKQFGFVQGRSIHEAMVNVITAIDWATEQEDEYIMINMDLEKAYDRVSWEYILVVIDRMGFGSLFLGMVKTLFQNASASVHINGYISDSFQLVRSIRQGCPLAPLLFAITTDPLLREFGPTASKTSYQAFAPSPRAELPSPTLC